jgi:PAS domain-containing protein
MHAVGIVEQEIELVAERANKARVVKVKLEIDLASMAAASSVRNVEAAGGTLEDALRGAERRFHEVVERLAGPIFMAVVGAGRSEIYLSPQLERMLGWDDEGERGPTPWRWRTKGGSSSFEMTDVLSGLRGRGPFRAECCFETTNGDAWLHCEASFGANDAGPLRFLQGIAYDITTTKLARRVLLDEILRGTKSAGEFEIARNLQTFLLPSDPQVDRLEIAATMLPATEVGGDYYDVLPFPGGAWIGIGDVSGHGLNSCLVQLMVQSAVMALTRSPSVVSPRDLVMSLNEVLFENIQRRLGGDDFVTFTLVRFTKDGRFMFAGAHEDIVVWRRKTNKVEVVPTPGVWLGVSALATATVDSEIRLEEGDLVLLYTDGVTEARNAKGECFGFARLCEVIEDRGEASPATLCDDVMAKVQSWMCEQRDDVTLVALRYLPE